MEKWGFLGGRFSLISGALPWRGWVGLGVMLFLPLFLVGFLLKILSHFDFLSLSGFFGRRLRLYFSLKGGIFKSRLAFRSEP